MVFLGLENYYFLNQCCDSNPTLHHSHKSWTQSHGDCRSQSASPLRTGLPCCSETPSGKEDLLHRRQGLQPGLRTASSVFLQNTAEACPLPGAAHIQGQTDGWAQRPLKSGQLWGTFQLHVSSVSDEAVTGTVSRPNLRRAQLCLLPS